jgi:hypothetical protein
MPSKTQTKYRLHSPAGAKDSAVRRLGLGQTGLSQSGVATILKSALSCPIMDVPNIEHTTWDITGPIDQEDVVATFGSEIDIFNSGKQVGGVSQVQTTFVHPGILQTGLIVIAVGFHIFADPLCFTALGNSLSPAPATTITQPISPDQFTQLDSNALLGLSGSQALQKSTLSWGWPMQYAAWHMINGYNFDWIVRNRYHLISESARYVAHFSSYADNFGAGNSQVAVNEFAARVNANYRQYNTGGIFLPVDHRRQGAFLQTGVEASAWRPTRDFALADVMWGGLNLQQRNNNKMFRPLTMPYYIPANTPIGLQLNESDTVQANLFRQYLSITNGGAAVPPITTPDANLAAGFGFASGEVSLDANPVLASTASQVGNAEFKGGTLELSMLIKGFEVDDDFAKSMTDPGLKQALQAEFGLQFCS